MTTDLLIYFLTHAAREDWCNTSHISLFVSLIMARSRQGDQDPFSTSRRQLMIHSKIQSKATYHKCMKDLIQRGVIRYIPSYHPVLGSSIWINPLKTKKRQ